MFRRLKILLLPAILLLGSCDSIHDSMENCGIYLRFVYDYNMQYTCTFSAHVGTVDVYVFDSDGKFLFSEHAVQSELIDGNKMYLDKNLTQGEFHVVTVGGLCDNFSFADGDSGECSAGKTSLQDLRLCLQRESAEVSHRFPDLWYGEAVVVAYPGYAKEYPVPLVKNTNRFNLVLHRQDVENIPDDSRVGGDASLNTLYSFEIITPEGAVYGHDNSPLVKETVRYLPYSLEPGVTSAFNSVGQINTMRLFEDGLSRSGDSGYRLIVRNRRTLKEAWNVDLVDVLRELKPATKKDGTPLPTQEYLDRESEWDIAILYRGGPADEHDIFLALAIEVNGWILWLHDMDV